MLKRIVDRIIRMIAIGSVEILSDSHLKNLLKVTPYMEVRRKIWMKLGNVLGKDAYINNNIILIDTKELKPNIVLGERVALSPYITFITCAFPNESNLKNNPKNFRYFKKGAIYVGDDTWIGTGVTIHPGITIGKNCIIGAMSNVTKNVPDNSLAYGNPINIVRRLD